MHSDKWLKKLNIVVIVMLLSLGIFPITESFADQDPTAIHQHNILGVFPYLPAARLEERHSPVAADFSKVLDGPVQLRTRDTFHNFRTAVKSQAYDIIFIQPFDYIRVGSPNGYKSVARWKGQLKAVFVTLGSSDIRSAKQFYGKNISMPSKDAAVSVLGRQYIIDNGLKLGGDVKIKYQRNHFACMKQVILKKSDICVTAEAPKKMFEKRSGMAMKTIVTTSSIPTTLFAIHIRVPEEKRKALTERIIGWSAHSEGKKILSGLRFESFVAADDSTYDVVRDIWEKANE